jgi:hypothetical protein
VFTKPAWQKILKGKLHTKEEEKGKHRINRKVFKLAQINKPAKIKR